MASTSQDPQILNQGRKITSTYMIVGRRSMVTSLLLAMISGFAAHLGVHPMAGLQAPQWLLPSPSCSFHA